MEACSYLNPDAHPIVIRHPYHELFQYRNEIREYANAAVGEKKRHILLLTKFITQNLGKMELLYVRPVCTPRSHQLRPTSCGLLRPVSLTKSVSHLDSTESSLLPSHKDSKELGVGNSSVAVTLDNPTSEEANT